MIRNRKCTYYVTWIKTDEKLFTYEDEIGNHCEILCKPYCYLYEVEHEVPPLALQSKQI